jgi:hypothetical protein
MFDDSQMSTLLPPQAKYPELSPSQAPYSLQCLIRNIAQNYLMRRQPYPIRGAHGIGRQTSRNIPETHLDSILRSNLGDTRTHQSRAKDSHAFDLLLTLRLTLVLVLRGTGGKVTLNSRQPRSSCSCSCRGG